jgi:hypothetical protein
MRRFVPLIPLAILAGCHKPQPKIDNADALINESAPVGDQAAQAVTLTAPDGVTVYNPARGTLVPMTASEFGAGRLTTLGSWTKPWFVVQPDRV